MGSMPNLQAGATKTYTAMSIGYTFYFFSAISTL